MENKHSFICSYFNNVVQQQQETSSSASSSLPSKSFELFRLTSKSLDILPDGQHEQLYMIELPNAAAPNTIQAEVVTYKKLKVLVDDVSSFQ